MITMPSNQWAPDKNQHQARRIGKTLEELSELSCVLARISIQGIDTVDSNTNITNRLRLLNELADVQAQIHCTILTLKLDQKYIDARRKTKIKLMGAYESHFNAL